jgi:hypothetical protein
MQIAEAPATRLRRPWQSQQRIEAYGARILVRTNRAKCMAALLTRLPLGSCLAAEDSFETPDRVHSIVFADGEGSTAFLRRDGRRIATCHGESELLDAFERELTWCVAQAARDRIFIHSGVVGWRDQAILIPGRSCFGKTTLVTRFLEAGATYYSDDMALLDQHGLVHPYARPLQIRRQQGSLIQTRVAAEEFRGFGGTGREPIRPVLMLLCKYRKGARWRPVELTKGEAALELVRYSFTAFRSPEAAFRAAGKTASHLKTWRGVRGEAQAVVEWALRTLDAGY